MEKLLRVFKIKDVQKNISEILNQEQRIIFNHQSNERCLYQNIQYLKYDCFVKLLYLKDKSSVDY